jgi:type VI secretion system protein VasG
MTPLDIRPLVAKLDDQCRRSLEAAAGLTLSRSHYNVEIEHWLLKLLDMGDSDLVACLKHFDIDVGRVAADLNRVLDRLKTGNTRAPALSPQIVSLVREAWVVASVVFGASRVRSGHILVTLLSDDGLAPVLREASGQFAKLSPERLRAELADITASTAEATRSAWPSRKSTVFPDVSIAVAIAVDNRTVWALPAA